jgi:hypothetical protein
MTKPTVGQTLFFVPSYSRDAHLAREVTVTKVGRMWSELSNGYRIGNEDWIADGGGYSSPGRCYASREEYEHELARQQYWESIVRSISDTWRCPEHLTIDGLNLIAEKLRIRLPLRRGGQE